MVSNPTTFYLLYKEGFLHDFGVQCPQPLHSLILPLAGFELLGRTQGMFQQYQADPEDDLHS